MRSKSKGKRSQRVNEHVLVVDLYNGRYFISDICAESKTMYTYLAGDGVSLTDNLLIPFTPINLWKEIWIEHKIIFSVVYPAIALLAGGEIVGLINIARALMSKLH